MVIIHNEQIYVGIFFGNLLLPIVTIMYIYILPTIGKLLTEV